MTSPDQPPKFPRQKMSDFQNLIFLTTDNLLILLVELRGLEPLTP